MDLLYAATSVTTVSAVPAVAEQDKRIVVPDQLAWIDDLSTPGHPQSGMVHRGNDAVQLWFWVKKYEFIEIIYKFYAT